MPESRGRPRHGDAPEPLPYARHSISPDDVGAVTAALQSSHLTQGPEVERFEQALARRVGVAHAVAASSGTAALELALGALGVGPGDEVLVPPITFLATANAVLRRGAVPVFVDVERHTLCLDPRAVAERVSSRTRGAIAVHFAGHPADVDGLRAALGPERFVLEDACHALGARFRGREAGALGDAACFSFHPAKHVTTGEGGAVTTGSAPLARLARSLRQHGVEREAERFEGLGLPPELADEERGEWVYEMQRLGHNARLPDFAAALGRSQLDRLGLFLERRRALAAAYTAALRDEPALELPREREGAVSAWHLYTVRVRREALRGGRAALFAGLRARGIGVQVHYVPVHLQPFYRALQGTGWGDLPVAEDEYLRLLSLPLFPAMHEKDVERVVDALQAELGRLGR